MSRTKHHRNKRTPRDFGAKYKVNAHYGQEACSYGKDLADKERRKSDKLKIEEGFKDV